MPKRIEFTAKLGSEDSKCEVMLNKEEVKDTVFFRLKDTPDHKTHLGFRGRK